MSFEEHDSCDVELKSSIRRSLRRRPQIRTPPLSPKTIEPIQEKVFGRKLVILKYPKFLYEGRSDLYLLQNKTLVKQNKNKIDQIAVANKSDVTSSKCLVSRQQKQTSER